MTVTPRSRPQALLALVAVLASVLTALAAAPADARPAGAKWPWVVGQTVQANGKVSMRLEWKKIARSKKYRIDYAPLKGNLSSGEVQKSHKKKSKIVKGGPGKLKHGVVSNLTAGKVYCFQVYGVSGKTYGNRGGVHCKMATRANRRPAASSFPMVVGTFNTCSSGAGCSAWSSRASAAVQRVKGMALGGRPADIVAVQEASLSTDTFDTALKPEFTRGCQTAVKQGQTVKEDDDQSLFVRTKTYDIVPNTDGGFQFSGHSAQGACWVRVREKSSGREVVVVSVHLTAGTAALRKSELNEVVTRVNAVAGGRPKIFAGDFNSRNSHTSRSYDVARTTMWARGGYDDSYDVATSFLSKPYYNSGGAHSSVPQVSWTWGDHIDKVFSPPGVHVGAWKVDYRMSGGRYVQQVSDHNPVVVSLAFPK